MNNKFIKMLITLVALTVLLIACSSNDTNETSSNENTSTDNEEKIVLRFPHIVDETHPAHLAAVQFAEEIAEKSEGRMEVQIFANAQLYASDREIIEALQLGSTDISIVGSPFVGSFDKRFFVLDLPFLFKDEATANEALEGELGEQLGEGLKEINLKSLAFGYDGFRHMSNNISPITQPEDLKGMKIRVLESQLHQDIFNTLGANASPLAFGELYSALQQNTYDGMDQAISTFYSSKFQEVQKYLSLTGHVYSGTVMLMNNTAFEEMPEDLQEVIMTASQTMKKEYDRLVAESNQELLDKLKEETDVEVNELTPEQHQVFVEAVQPVYEKYAQELGQDIVELARSYNK